jgi:GTPase SAR1 family protein
MTQEPNSWDAILNVLRSELDGLGRSLPSSLLEKLTTLEQDIAGDAFIVVVLGQFKRGKSSLVNALLGTSILPIGDLPETAAIHVLIHGEAPSVKIVKADGSVTALPFEPQTFRSLSAQSDFDPKTVDYVEVRMPSDLLAHRLVLVDTPGVSDLSLERADITYNYIPRADAVVFVIDITQPFNEAEFRFLQSHVFSAGIDKILFVANFADQVDLEEIPRLRTSIERRIAGALNVSSIAVLPLSAAAGPIGLPLDSSGISALRVQVLSMLDDRESIKAGRFRQRILDLIASIDAHLSALQSLQSSETEDLNLQLSFLEQQRQQEADSRIKLQDWIHARRDEILAMISRSVAKFSEDLRQEILASVTLYQGLQFKTHVEQYIPAMVQRRCKDFIEAKAPAIIALLDQMTEQIATAISRKFATDVRIDRASLNLSEVQTTFFVFADDIKSVKLKAGLIGGGAVVLASVLGFGYFAPLLMLTGYPWLLDNMGETALADARAKVLPDIEQAISETAALLRERLIGQVDTEIGTILELSNGVADGLYSDAAKAVEAEITARGPKQLASVVIDVSAIRERLESLRLQLKSTQGTTT